MFKNKIYGVEFSSPPKQYEVLKLMTKLLKEKRGLENTNELEEKHTEIIERDLQSWNLIDANEFRKIYNEHRHNVRVLSYEEMEKINLSSQKWATIIILIIFFGIFGLIGYAFLSGKEERDLKQQAENEYYRVVASSEIAVKSLLKDPNSAEFKDQNYNCGYVNSKNSFGGYVGFKRYVVVFDKAIIEDANSTSESMTKLWDSACRK